MQLETVTELFRFSAHLADLPLSVLANQEVLRAKQLQNWLSEATVPKQTGPWHHSLLWHRSASHKESTCWIKHCNLGT